MAAADHPDAPLAATDDGDGDAPTEFATWPTQEPRASAEGNAAIAEEQEVPAPNSNAASVEVPVSPKATAKPGNGDTGDGFSDMFSDVFQGNIVEVANVKEKANRAAPKHGVSEDEGVKQEGASNFGSTETSYVEDTGDANCKDDAATITTQETKLSGMESADKRRERRKLRRGSPKPTRTSGDDSSAQNLVAVSNAGEAMEVGEMPAAPDEDTSIVTNNSKEALDTTSTAVSSERRRERRRKFLQGRSDGATNTPHGEGGDGDESENAAEDDNSLTTNLFEGPSMPTSAEKRRERRKLRDQHQSEGDDAGAQLQDPTEPLVKTRRQKVAERVAQGKVPIPQALRHTTLTHATSALAGGEDKEGDGTMAKKTPPQTPTSKSKKSLLSGAKTPTTPDDTSSPSSERLIMTPTNEVEMMLVEAGEGGAEEAETKEPPTLPDINPAPSPDRNEARRNRRLARHLSKGPATGRDRVEMALNVVGMDEGEEGENEQEPDTIERAEDDPPAHREGETKDGKGKSSRYVSDIVKSKLVDALEKDRRVTSVGSNSPASSVSSVQSDDAIDPEISKQIAAALEKAHSMDKDHPSVRASSPTPSFPPAKTDEVSNLEVLQQMLDREALDPIYGADAAVRSSSPTSSFVSDQPSDAVDPEVSKQIALALNRAKKQKDSKEKEELDLGNSMELVKDSIVDGREAEELFPPDTSFTPIPSEESEHATANDSAWDASGAPGMTAVLESSKARNKEIAADVGGRPLLHLETIASDQRVDGTLESASSKLLSQQQRMALYTSGEGFGVGEDSSVDSENEIDDSMEDEGEEDAGVEVIDYEDMNNIIDDASDQDEGDEALDVDQYVPPADGYENNVPTFSIAGESNVPRDSRVRRWDRNPDAMSDVDDESEMFDVKSGTTADGSSVFGLHFVGSNSVSGTSTSQQTPPHSPFERADPDATPKIGTKRRGNKGSPVKLLKIPPPPAEKLRQWEESKGLSSRPVAEDPSLSIKMAESDQASTDAPDTAKAHRRANSLNNLNDMNLSYKIQLPKSPHKKSLTGAHTVTEELDLDSHPRMAEKIALASSKAARKFEEKYSHHRHETHEPDEGLDAKGKQKSDTAGSNRFFCADDDPPVDEEQGDDADPLLSMATTGLVRGAFSPWKISDEDDASSIASSSVAPNAVASGAAKPLRGSSHARKDNSMALDSLNESFEVSLEDDREGRRGALTGVLQWLFADVLAPDSPTVAAFSAFDINASTTVQADRLLAIAKDDECFNAICDFVATNVIVREASEVNATTEDASPQILAAGSYDDNSVSTFESSAVGKAQATNGTGHPEDTIEAFNIPTPANDSSYSSDTRLSSGVLAANFVGFLQQIETATGLSSPYGNSNPFLHSVVAAMTARKQDVHTVKETKSMQELVFTDEAAVVKVFLFLRDACKGGTDSQQKMLTSIDEGTNDTMKQRFEEPTPFASTDEEVVPLHKGGRSVNPKQRHNHNSKRKASHKTHKHSKGQSKAANLNLVVPDESPSPFETAVWNDPSIVLTTLSFLGDPVAVCGMKRLNVFCNRVVVENQHVLMRDAVRLGGMSKYVRPSFWLWVTERSDPADPIPLVPSRRGFEHTLSSHTSTSSSVASKYKGRDFVKLKELGAKGKWQHIIERDVTRSFGNLPPHKTGARYRQDSIVRALVSFGREELMRNGRGYHGMDKLPEDSEAKHFKLSSRFDRRDDSSNCSSATPTDTVSDWGGISPVGSMVDDDPSVGPAEADKSMQIVSYENGELLDKSAKQALKLNLSQQTSRSDVSDPVLSGNALTGEMKVDLQDKLRSILHALAARHEAVGYCQGMDYVVAHLLRVLQDTILLRQVQRSMPGREEAAEDWRTISSDELRGRMSAINSQSAVVEEVVFGVMDTFFSTYGLQHMYWPELRCLKTCCRVFEKVIKQKLPVLADHFEHHELNVGLFALGWFQTLFLYLPSMPSTTVCHMWDIWLVERSFKIFFRVGTAILFLSQPTLLNHDLEGMMTYLNTFPDATLLRRDILIPCALQIKITNRMLAEIEMEIAKTNQADEQNEFFR